MASLQFLNVSRKGYDLSPGVSGEKEKRNREASKGEKLSFSLSLSLLLLSQAAEQGAPYPPHTNLEGADSATFCCRKTLFKMYLTIPVT